LRVFNFLLFILGDLIFFFWCEGGGFALVNFEHFLFLLFWSSQVFNFSCHFVGFQKNIVWSFVRVERGVFAFLLVNFKSFLFSYFEVSKFSISLLIILWVFKKSCVKFRKGREGVLCLSSCELWKFFVFVFWSYGIFNFLLVILGVFKFFCVKFSQVRKWVCAFLHVNFESFLFSYFEILKSSIFLLSFWRFHMGENNVRGFFLKIWGFSYLFWCNSRIFNFVFRNFKGFSKNI